jgi:hypothetical protein
MGKSKDLFSKFDLHAKDIPKAILIHELLGIAMLAITWTACYHIQFSKFPVIKNRLNQIATMIPQQVSQSFSRLPYMDTKEILQSRIGSSYLESSCLRKLIRPVTLPAKILLTYKLVKAFGTVEPEVISSVVTPEPANVKRSSLLRFNKLIPADNLPFPSFI